MVVIFFLVVALGIYEDVFKRLSDWAISLVSIWCSIHHPYYFLFPLLSLSLQLHFPSAEHTADLLTTVYDRFSSYQLIPNHTSDTPFRYHLMLQHFARRS